jgi:hypothetical protein
LYQIANIPQSADEIPLPLDHIRKPSPGFSMFSLYKIFVIGPLCPTGTFFPILLSLSVKHFMEFAPYTPKGFLAEKIKIVYPILDRISVYVPTVAAGIPISGSRTGTQCPSAYFRCLFPPWWSLEKKGPLPW